MMKSKKLIFCSIIVVVFVITISLITVFSFKPKFNAKKDESKLEQNIVNNDVQQPVENIQNIEDNTVDDIQQLELDNDKKEDVEDGNQEINNIIGQPKLSVNQNNQSSSNNSIKPIVKEESNSSIPSNNVIKEDNKQGVTNNINTTVNIDIKNESNNNGQVTTDVVNDNSVQNDNVENNNNSNNEVNVLIENQNNDEEINEKYENLSKTIEECNQRGIEIQLKYRKLNDIENTFCFSVANDYGELVGYRIVIECKSGNCDKYKE